MKKIAFFFLISLTSCKSVRHRHNFLAELQPRQTTPQTQHLDAGLALDESAQNPVRRAVYFSFASNMKIAELTFDNATKALYAADLADGIHVSKNQGETWSKLGAGKRCQQVLPTPKSAIYAICDDNLMFLPTQNKEWQKLPPPKGPKHDVVPEKLAINTAHPERLYVAGRGEQDHNGLFFTENLGKTWFGIESITMLDDDGTPRKLTAVDEVVLGFAVHPTIPDFVVALLTYGVFVSTDGGRNFLSAGLLEAPPQLTTSVNDSHQVVRNSRVQFDSVDPTTIYVLSDRGFEVSRSSGVDWRVYRQEDPIRIFAAHPDKAGILYAQSVSNVLMLSTNFGESWEPIGRVEIKNALELFFRNWKNPENIRVINDLELERSLIVMPENGRMFGAKSSGLAVVIGIP